MKPHITRALAVTALVALAACSGGGAAIPAKTAGSTASNGHGRATLTIKRFMPQIGTSAKTRRVNEVSFGTNSLVIDATQNSASVYHAVFDLSGAVFDNNLNCGTDSSGFYQICTATLLLPLGSETLNIATNSARDGSGSTLGSATLPVTILNAQDNPLAVTLDGVAASMKLFAADPSPSIGTPETIALTTQLYDATGTVFIAPQNYTQPVVVTDLDTSASTELVTTISQNSTQRAAGAAPAPSNSTPAKTASIPDRYTQANLTYDGTLTSAFQITAAFGSLNASVTITPSAAAPRPAGTNPQTHSWPANSPRGYDPIYDSAGNLWVTITGGKIASLDPATFQVTATYTIPAANRSLRAPVLGPDGGIYLNSGTISNGATTAPWFVTRFDPATHAFTDFAANDSVLHLVNTPTGLWGAERNIGKLWQLPFTGTTPAAAANEFAVSMPPVTDTTTVLEPLPTRVFPAADGNLWVVETSYAAVDGTWLAKYSTTGTLVSQALVVAGNPSLALDAQAMDANGNIWFANINNGNEFERDNTAATPNTLTTYAVPRLYGQNAFSETTQFDVLDPAGNLWFISSLTNQTGRIDLGTGRVDLLAGPNASNIFGITIAPNGTLVEAGQSGTTPFIFTTNTN